MGVSNAGGGGGTETDRIGFGETGATSVLAVGSVVWGTQPPLRTGVKDNRQPLSLNFRCRIQLDIL